MTQPVPDLPKLIERIYGDDTGDADKAVMELMKSFGVSIYNPLPSDAKAFAKAAEMIITEQNK